MNEDFLLDALNEISDEHIAEAALYEKKRKISLGKAIGVVACLVIAVVSAVAVTWGDVPSEPSGTVNTDASIIVTTEAATNAPSTAAPAITAAPTTAAVPEKTSEATTIAGEDDTTVARAPELSQTNGAEVTVGCPTTIPWESSPYSYCYRQFSFNGVPYVNYYGALIGEEKLSVKLGQTVLAALDDKGNAQKVNADIFAIDGVSTDCAVALYFWDGVQKQSCAQGYYVYYNNSYAPENLGQAMDEMGFDKNMIFGVSDIYIHYDKTTDNTVEVRKYIINESAIKSFESLLKNSAGIKSETFDYDSKIRTENIIINGSYFGVELSFSLNSEGYLYFGLGGNELCYNIGTEAIKKFLEVIDSECQIENSTSPALNMTTTSQTTQSEKG